MRARDRLGRPVDSDSPDAYPQVAQRTDISAEQAWSEALDYLDEQLPFHAHEVFEQRWRCCPSNERAQWQALARWCAALTQAARGHAESATSMAQSVLADLPGISESAPVRWDTVRSSLISLT